MSKRPSSTLTKFQSPRGTFISFIRLTRYIKQYDPCVIQRHYAKCISSYGKIHRDSSYLPGKEVNRDHEGGSSSVRPLHCTSDGLTPTITPNVGNSNAQFLIVGDCVRALPYEFWCIQCLNPIQEGSTCGHIIHPVCFEELCQGMHPMQRCHKQTEIHHRDV